MLIHQVPVWLPSMLALLFTTVSQLQKSAATPRPACTAVHSKVFPFSECPLPSDLLEGDPGLTEFFRASSLYSSAFQCTNMPRGLKENKIIQCNINFFKNVFSLSSHYNNCWLSLSFGLTQLPSFPRLVVQVMSFVN